jgi:hypothetical protein
MSAMCIPGTPRSSYGMYLSIIPEEQAMRIQSPETTAADPKAQATPVPSCCASSVQSSCCEPTDKPGCCGSDATTGGGCGCL